jgi:hypothetical protein
MLTTPVANRAQLTLLDKLSLLLTHLLFVYLSHRLTGIVFFHIISKGLKHPENQDGKKPDFWRSLNQHKPI